MYFCFFFCQQENKNKGRIRKRGRGRDLPSIGWVLNICSDWDWTKLNKEHRAIEVSHMMVRGLNTPHSVSAAFSGALSWSWVKNGTPRPKLILRWDAEVPGGGLTHSTMIPDHTNISLLLCFIFDNPILQGY